MKKLLAAAVAAMLMAGSAGASVIAVNFDTVDNWTAGSGTLTSYQSDHVYSESGWTFTGGPALRNTTATQDGFPGAFGSYSWRLRDAAVAWTATYTLALGAGDYFYGFGFDARRWDGAPSPNYTVSYSFDGGSTFSVATSIGSAGVLDNAALNDSSDWMSFSQSVASPTGLGANQFVVKFESPGGGERIMVDNFSSSAIPEPATFGLLAGFGALLALRRRRRG